MLVLSSVESKDLLTLFESDAVSDFAAKHHLIAAHVVVHDVFKCRQICDFIDQVEINQFVCGYLYPNVTFDEEEKSTCLDRMEQLPSSFASQTTVDLLEEIYTTRTPCYQRRSLE